MLKSYCAFSKGNRLHVPYNGRFLHVSFYFLCMIFWGSFLLSSTLCGSIAQDVKESREKNSAFNFQDCAVRDYSFKSSRSNAFKLPLLLKTSLEAIKNGAENVKNNRKTKLRSHCVSRRSIHSCSRKKIKTFSRNKKISYRIKRKTIRRFSSLSREKAEQFARLKIAIGLLCPLQRSHFWLSSPFGHRKMINGLWGFHAGIDMAAIRGTPVRAAASGKVIRVSASSVGYGNMILIAHEYHMVTRYAHLCKIKVKEGQFVRKGDIIATVGNTGNVRHKKGGDGSHLHFEVYVAKKRVNPSFFIN